MMHYNIYWSTYWNWSNHKSNLVARWSSTQYCSSEVFGSNFNHHLSVYFFSYLYSQTIYDFFHATLIQCLLSCTRMEFVTLQLKDADIVSVLKSLLPLLFQNRIWYLHWAKWTIITFVCGHIEINHSLKTIWLPVAKLANLWTKKNVFSL